MASRLSRRKITSYIADLLVEGKHRSKAVTQLAAYLIESGRTKEVELVTRDIEYELFSRGVIVARVTTASELSAATRHLIDSLLTRKKTDKIHMTHTKDPSVLGGIKIDIPGQQLDTTIIRKLQALKTNYRK